jgi:hypothetical protein
MKYSRGDRRLQPDSGCGDLRRLARSGGSRFHSHPGKPCRQLRGVDCRKGVLRGRPFGVGGRGAVRMDDLRGTLGNERTFSRSRLDPGRPGRDTWRGRGPGRYRSLHERLDACFTGVAAAGHRSLVRGRALRRGGFCGREAAGAGGPGSHSSSHKWPGTRCGPKGCGQKGCGQKRQRLRPGYPRRSKCTGNRNGLTVSFAAGYRLAVRCRVIRRNGQRPGSRCGQKGQRLRPGHPRRGKRTGDRNIRRNGQRGLRQMRRAWDGRTRERDRTGRRPVPPRGFVQFPAVPIRGTFGDAWILRRADFRSRTLTGHGRGS